uniref:Uncharacterized protein n=1 Tax=Panagrolaimus davidi TaxID=227884 RepID=A0A914QL34_9BILA
MKFQLFILLSTLFIIASGIGSTQSSGAKGILKCDSKPDAKVVVKLYDDDRGIDTDDLMGTTKTDSDGHFEVSGHTSEISTIDPKLNIYTDCNDKATPCQRKITIKIPDSYVTKGKNPEKIYDAGVIQLAGKFPGEERDCLH